MAILKKGFVRFGIPNWSSPWTGRHILSVEIVIKTAQSVIRAHNEHRNYGIASGTAIDLLMPFTSLERAKITSDNVLEFELWLALYYGDDEGPEGTYYRTEAILEFIDNKYFASGYNDPAGTDMITMNAPILFDKIAKGDFFTQPTIQLKGGIGLAKGKP